MSLIQRIVPSGQTTRTDAAHGTYLQFTTTPLGSASWTERMRITPDGRVTIGTTASGFYPTLRVVGAATAAGGDGVYGESISNGGYGVFGQSTGDNGVGVYGYAPGTGGTAVTAFSSSGLALAASSGAGAASTMAYFSGAGRVGIGTTSAQDKLDVRGDIRLGTGATGCLKDADGTVLTGVCVSDRRFKSAVTPFARSLEAVTQLQPVHFNWRATEFPDRHFGNTH